MKIQKDKYMDATLTILHGLLASGQYKHENWESKSSKWQMNPVVDAMGIADEFFDFTDSCMLDDEYFDIKE